MAITFPPTDDTTPDDGSVKYTDPDNGREYYWNGYAWELVCEEGGGVSGDFLLKYGDTVDDASAKATYFWNEGVELLAGDDANTPNTSFLLRDGDIGIGASSLITVEGHGVDINSTGNTIELRAQSDLLCYSKHGNVDIKSDFANELVSRTITDSDPDKQITNKEYVDGLFDFSQYEELS